MYRCQWARGSELEIRYHDVEWGVPVRDDRVLFEFLTLEGAQAGLSWSTILKKRDNYRQAFMGFDVASVARYDKRQMAALLEDQGIVRNRLKIASTVSNAQHILTVKHEFGSFADYIWQFVDGEPIQNQWRALAEIPAHSPESQQMSKDLRRRGFRFVGPTICYAFMQAVGMVNDHETRCFRHRQLGKRSG
ncbi:MAG: DNA-3-methyladenine glycosylase I [Candidatus Krumholzibacteria bacterium]|nr:DNA-3-methyladenine glycosylase I [Candidatus Krumholzibacteria bacterium]